MVAGKFLNPRNDLVFKRIFGTEKNKDILVHFLNDILDRPFPIKDVTFLKTIQDPEIAPLRVSIIDVMCADEQGNRFIIEMQLSHEKGFDRRALYYAMSDQSTKFVRKINPSFGTLCPLKTSPCHIDNVVSFDRANCAQKSGRNFFEELCRLTTRAYCAQRTENKKFHELKDVYFLAITDFTPFPKKKAWLSRIGLKDLETNEHDIRAIQLFFMQLPLFKKTKEDLSKMALREKWAYFFKYGEDTTEKDLEEIVGNDVILKRAYEELDRFGWTEKELNNYESIEMKKAADEAVKEALEEAAFEEGEKSKALEIAQTLLKECLSIAQVSKLTGLSVEEVESLPE